MRVNAGDSIPISRKEREAPKDCGCKEREGVKLLDKKILVEGDLKLFVEILGMREGKKFLEKF